MSVDQMAQRLADRLQPIFAADIKGFSSVIAGFCESPIETAMGAALFYLCHVNRGWPVIYMSTQARAQLKPGVDPKAGGALDCVRLAPQYHFENYRIDWAVFQGIGCVFVECDGHEFHERTKEQAAHDRQKDRAIQTAGIPILRFTGSEIYRDAVACAAQVLDVLHARKSAA